MTTHPWIANRTTLFDSSGIRKIFDLAANLENPVNLSIGQPDFDVPEEIRAACIDSIQTGKNGYALSQGMPILLDKLQSRIDEEYGHADRRVFVSSGTSGGLVLAMLALVDPGDEVIVFDPFFVMYEPLVGLVGGHVVSIDTCPDFRIDTEQVEAKVTDKTKMILFNSPSNPTGVVATPEEIKSLAEICERHNIILVSDEIYRQFCYDQPFQSPTSFNEQTVVIDGFSKSHAMTGWRLGFVHGPSEVIDTMVKLQQYSFVCAPQPAQWAGAVAMDVDIQPIVEIYRGKRDKLVSGLENDFEMVNPGGAFYAFPKAPWGTGEEFVKSAITNNLLVIPGNIFSHHNTHFRLSYAADDATIDQGVEILRELARRGA